MRAFASCLLLLLAAAAPAHAQADEDDQAICVSVAHIWRGTNADIARIREAPVPESFRRPFSGGGCARYQLVVASLVDWHLAFGDEASAAAALAYIAADHRAGAPEPADCGRVLAGAWRAAGRDLRAAAAILARPEASPGTNWRAFSAALNRSPRVARLRALIQVHGRYLFLAEHYLRASEFYGSAAMLAEAQAYFVAVRDAMPFLYAAPAADGFPDQEIRNALVIRQQHPGEVADAELRLAIQAARLGRDPAAIDAAQRSVDAAFSPVLREAADHLDRQRDFCDRSGDEDLSGIREACNAENDFARRFVRFWQAQARADLLMAADPVHYMERPRAPPLDTSGSSFVRRPVPGGRADRDIQPPQSVETALAILRRAREDQLPVGPIFGRAWDAIVALQLERADMYARLAAAAESGARPGGGDAADLLVGALSDLIAAAGLVPPPEDPGRFRRIAARFLLLVERYEADRARQTGAHHVPDPRYARQAAYFRHVLAGLDRIAVGEPPTR